MSRTNSRWLGLVGALAVAAVCPALPRAVCAQQVGHARLASAPDAPARDVSRTPFARARDSVARPFRAPPLEARRQARRPIALRGLLVGAIVGGAVGYYFGRHEEYGGAVGGSLVGAVLGAPVGMITLLLVTPS